MPTHADNDDKLTRILTGLDRTIGTKWMYSRSVVRREGEI
jgi:hypothetical protein